MPTVVPDGGGRRGGGDCLRRGGGSLAVGGRGLAVARAQDEWRGRMAALLVCFLSCPHERVATPVRLTSGTMAGAAMHFRLRYLPAGHGLAALLCVFSTIRINWVATPVRLVSRIVTGAAMHFGSFDASAGRGSGQLMPPTGCCRLCAVGLEKTDRATRVRTFPSCLLALCLRIPTGEAVSAECSVCSRGVVA